MPQIEQGRMYTHQWPIDKQIIVAVRRVGQGSAYWESLSFHHGAVRYGVTRDDFNQNHLIPIQTPAESLIRPDAPTLDDELDDLLRL